MSHREVYSFSCGLTTGVQQCSGSMLTFFTPDRGLIPIHDRRSSIPVIPSYKVLGVRGGFSPLPVKPKTCYQGFAVCYPLHGLVSSDCHSKAPWRGGCHYTHLFAYSMEAGKPRLRLGGAQVPVKRLSGCHSLCPHVLSFCQATVLVG